MYSAFSGTCTQDMINDKTGMCYGVVNTNGDKDFNRNKDSCKRNKGTLAVLNDMDKINFLKSRPQLFSGLK